MRHLRTWFSGEHGGGGGLIVGLEDLQVLNNSTLWKERPQNQHPSPSWGLTGGSSLHVELWSHSSRHSVLSCPSEAVVGHSSSLCSLPPFMLICKTIEFHFSLTNRDFWLPPGNCIAFHVLIPGVVWALRADFDPTPLSDLNRSYQEQQLYFSKSSYNNMNHVLKNNIIQWILKSEMQVFTLENGQDTTIICQILFEIFSSVTSADRRSKTPFNSCPGDKHNSCCL